MTKTPLLLLALGAILPGAPAVAACLPRADAVLAGTLRQGAGQDAAGRTERYWVVELAAPACVAAGRDAELAPPHAAVDRVQLAVGDDALRARLVALRGRAVRVTGSLFDAHTAHHHTEVLIDVNALAPAP